MGPEEKKARGEWPFPPMLERIYEKVWAVCTYGIGDVSLRGVNYHDAERHAECLVRRGIRNICVYPEDEARAIEAYIQQGKR